MGNMAFSWAKKLMERWYLLIHEKVLFWTWNWWKDDNYWLRRSSYFELFRDEKYSFFLAKMLMERWYLHGLFELSIIFQHLGNMTFWAVPFLFVKNVWCQYIKVKWREYYRLFMHVFPRNYISTGKYPKV